jgi:trehalose 6-phosphate phosphatase
MTPPTAGTPISTPFSTSTFPSIPCPAAASAAMMKIDVRLVPVASRSSYPSQKIRSGTITVPPPTPNRPLNAPAAVAIAAKVSNRGRDIGGDTSEPMGAGSEAIDSLLDPLRAEPDRSAILSDLDGTLAPIVADPFAATVPPHTREVLERLCERYVLVGCVTGRRAADARRIAGVRGMVYVGNHGLEALRPGEGEPGPTVELGEAARAAAEVVAGLDREELAAAGIRIEDKGPIQALHWRTAADEERAAEIGRGAAEQAAAAGLVPRWGRKVLELRPAEADKGGAVRSLVASRDLRRAMFGGDDVTDLDAFAALRELERDGRLRAAIAVGVDSPEAPEGLAAASDLLVSGTDSYLDVLQFLADGG